MNRRNFLASLIALPVGLVAAAKACANSPGLNLDEMFEKLYRLRDHRKLTSHWFQTTRTTHCYSMDFLDAIDSAMGVPEPEKRAAYIARRKERSRRNIAELKSQRPLPLP